MHKYLRISEIIRNFAAKLELVTNSYLYLLTNNSTFMKKLTFVLAALLAVSTAFAQISTGEPNSSVIPRTGNRPQAGDFGLYLGASVTQIMDFVRLNKNTQFTENAFWALPAINLKYYFTDNWEGRIGFQFACKGTTEKYNPENGDMVKNTSDVNYTRFLPGCAYHFNTKNIVDVYLGAQLPIGFNLIQDKSVNGDVSITNKNNQFVIGGGIFFGLQFFVADLPLAIGIETGYSGTASFSSGDRTIVNNDGDKTTTLHPKGGLPDVDVKSSLYMEGRWGADAALTITYYFKN